MASSNLFQSLCVCVFLSPAFFKSCLFWVPYTSLFFPLSLLNSIRPLSLLLLSSPFRPSLSLLTQTLHCFDIWPNYLVHWGSCSCHTVWWWGTVSCCLHCTVYVVVMANVIVCRTSSLSAQHGPQGKVHWLSHKQAFHCCRLLHLLTGSPFIHYSLFFYICWRSCFFLSLLIACQKTPGLQVSVSSRFVCCIGACLYFYLLTD